MKLTKTQLREMIREELSKSTLTESTTVVSAIGRRGNNVKRESKNVDRVLQSSGITDKKQLSDIVSAITKLANAIEDDAQPPYGFS
jgi:hypothetical protein